MVATVESKNNRNRLAHEKSPYLLQHSDNPVDWYPWGEEAFEKAKKENKPIFLSIGYSTCHWCHVMAHESFEDPEIGDLINDTFVSIKVDREERPDIDMVYMSVCQIMTGSGGWPLTVILTPDKKPFFAGTYIPRETRFGRPGMSDFIQKIKEIWATRKDEVLNSASQITEALSKASDIKPGKDLDEAVLHLAYEQLRGRFDEEHGGFGGAPKFPTPHCLLFLLRYWKRANKPEALYMVEKTLQAIRRGGIYDQIGFGIHRYSTDQQWFVPHFEKMLYDQALTAIAYIETFQITGKEEYAKTAREIFDYVLRDLTDTNGGFYSAEDADSENEEGKYYLWTYDEIKKIVGIEEADFLIKIFNIAESGNFADELSSNMNGSNILYQTRSLEEWACDFNVSISEIQERLESIRQKLYSHREKRIRPQKDDKVLADWNGLMVAALSKGGRILDEPAYIDAAKRAVSFIFDEMFTPEGRLLHRYRDGEAALSAVLDDYSFMIYGLLELYETSFEVNYLNMALRLNEQMLKHFFDDENDGFYFTPDDGENLLIRQKEIYDGAIPSGNSIAMLNLLRLSRITADSDLEQKAIGIGRCFFENVKLSPSAHTQLLVAVDFAVGPSYEIVITGDPNGEDTKDMLRVVQCKFIPNKILIYLPEGPDSLEIKRVAPFTGELSIIDSKATAYICSNYNCKLPTRDTDIMLSLLNS